MRQFKQALSVCACGLAAVVAWSGSTAHADRGGDDNGQGAAKRPRKVIVIAMENHNWTQPGGPGTGSPQQIFLNPAAPFINSLVDGTSGISSDVAYATNYINAGIGVHPSEPNYVWAEAGQAFNSLGTDADPYFPGPSPAACTPRTVVTTDQHLSAFLTKAGKTWRSYQEDVNVNPANVPLPMTAWKAPIASRSGNFTGGGLNAYNYSTQFNYA